MRIEKNENYFNQLKIVLNYYVLKILVNLNLNLLIRKVLIRKRVYFLQSEIQNRAQDAGDFEF